MNASPDTSTPPWPSISGGTKRERDRERTMPDRVAQTEKEREIETAKSWPSITTLMQRGRWRGSAVTEQGRDPDTTTPWSSITPESRAENGAETDRERE